MSLSTETIARAPRWPSAERRACIEAEALIAEHDAATDPERIDEVALHFLLLFSPTHPPKKEDLLVVDELRNRARAIRNRRRC
jgi:hypothetical protein